MLLSGYRAGLCSHHCGWSGVGTKDGMAGGASRADTGVQSRRVLQAALLLPAPGAEHQGRSTLVPTSKRYVSQELGVSPEKGHLVTGPPGNSKFHYAFMDIAIRTRTYPKEFFFISLNYELSMKHSLMTNRDMGKFQQANGKHQS